MERMERLLFEASVDGNITVLQMLLQEDPLILDRLALNRHGDTPLHIASMLGHTEFVKEILTRNPHLATEYDSQRHLPLHIASAKGHVEIVKALVSANPETCLARDRDGRNPIHLAAIKGRCEVVKELLQAQSHAARAMVQQETILHMCVKHNQLEVLKLLIETMGDHEFVNTKDVDGNTILHLAVADKQLETINFLLLDTTIDVNASNTNGDTSMDILAHVPRDLKYHQIMRSLTRAGAVEEKPQGSFGSIPKNSRTKMRLDRLEYHYKPPAASYLKEHCGDWLDRKRNSLMVVASLIATMAFQAGIDPPSGVWKDDSNTDPVVKARYEFTANHRFKIPFSDFSLSNQDLSHIFLISNTVGFVSTLSIIVLLISGLPILKHRFFLWILMVIMWISTTSMSLTYSVSILVLTPTSEAKSITYVAFGIVLVWIVLMTLLLVGHTIRLIAIALRGIMLMTLLLVRHTIRLIAIALKGRRNRGGRMI